MIQTAQQQEKNDPIKNSQKYFSEEVDKWPTGKLSLIIKEIQIKTTGLDHL